MQIYAISERSRSSLQIIHQESDPKSQDEIPVLSSYGKNLECYVRDRHLRKNVCGWPLSSGHSEQEA